VEEGDGGGVVEWTDGHKMRWEDEVRSEEGALFVFCSFAKSGVPVFSLFRFV